MKTYKTDVATNLTNYGTGSKEYRVGFWYTEYGIAKVKAQSPKEAEDKLFEFLGESGDLNKLDYKCTDGDFGVQDAEELK